MNICSVENDKKILKNDKKDFFKLSLQSLTVSEKLDC